MSHNLRVAVLVDRPCVSRQVAALVAWIDQQPNMQCSLWVVSPAAHERKAKEFRHGALRGLLWSAMLVIESWRVGRSSFSLQPVDSVDLRRQAPRGGLHEFDRQPDESDTVVGARVRDAWIGALPDLVLHCGSGQGSRAFADCARLGVLEMVLGCSQGLAEDSFGFWEVLNQNDKTLFALRQVPPSGQRVRTVAHGHLPTQTSFLMNQSALWSQIQDSIQHQLTRLAGDDAAQLRPLNVVAETVHRAAPSTQHLLAYCAAVARRSLTFRLRSVVGLQERWQVHYKAQDWTQLSPAGGRAIPNPRGGYFADPFLHVTDAGVFCFVEEFRERIQRGVISVLRLDPQGPVYLGRVLDEPFHLSFPFLFEHDGELFMCPESHQARQIRIYKCTAFPLQWELHSVAMNDVVAVDSMIFAANGSWWMLAGLLPQGDLQRFPELNLFSTHDPLSGEWRGHPQNPLRIDPEFARNAGLLRRDGRLFRVSQTCAFSAYGASINVSDIHTLTSGHYVEMLFARFNAGFKEGVSGMHHMDAAAGITVWDEKRWHLSDRGWRRLLRPFRTPPPATNTSSALIPGGH